MLRSIITHGAVFLVLSLLAWPVFVVSALLVSYLAGEGSVINTWHLEPKRNLLAYFIEGYIGSAPFAAALAALAVACGIVPAAFKAARLAVLILLPLAGLAIAYTFYTDTGAVQLAFTGAGLVLALISIALSRLARRICR